MPGEIPIRVEPVNNRELAISFKYDPLLVEKVKGIPNRRWDKDNRRWVFPPTPENITFVQKWFPHAQWDPKCHTFQKEAAERAAQRKEISRVKLTGDLDLSVLDKVKFKMQPMTHQKIALLLGRDMEVFAYLMDQGTGKTKVIIDDAAHNFRKKRVNGLLIIAPNSVKTNWVDPDGGEDEISKHMPPDVSFNSGCWVASPTKAQKERFARFEKQCGKAGALDVLVVNVEGLSFARCFEYVQSFCKAHKTFIAVDESTRIKHRSTERTKAVLELRKNSAVRRIASGTPVIKSPLNAFSQFAFLDTEILGYANYKSFEARYGVKGGFEGRQILYYQNLDELQERIDSCSYRVLKDDCLDLPPKIYQKRQVHLAPKQLAAYRAMADEAIIEYETRLENGDVRSSWIEANIVLTKYLRLQQITSGFLPILDEAGQMIGYKPFDKVPPKIQEALDIIEECQNKVIVWARFTPEVEMMCNALRSAGINYVRFDGSISEADRVNARNAFQSDSSGVKVFVGQVQTGGIGITLNKARTVIYLSNTFNTEDRVQSEDRAHRIGTDGAVTYIDLVAPGTVDGKIIACLRENKKIADQIMKDGIREWI